ncbi:MAG: M23 family metallopeptidase [Porticoccaceae bacterium]|jgi:murein DD-endopeptidase MepM/ murein hydrolase activator NlpD|nr:M23 family metallopeptidase [Porticoccaceae bacterium]
MKLLIIKGNHGRTTSVHLNLWMKALLSVCVFGAPLATGWWIGANQSNQLPIFFQNLSESMQADLSQQREQVAEVTTEADKNLRALSLRIAELQARLTRIEALGQRVAVRADLAGDEFDFASVPALGGPLTNVGEGSYISTELAQRLAELDTQISDRQVQLNMLSALMFDRQLRDDASPSGLPAGSGWVSSHYGMRADPFTGEEAWHNGVDIAGREGSSVLAVASGVVTYTDQSLTYGNVVEITHDAGLVTLYAHNKDLFVELGEVVRKGQEIAAMGTTGRSTGPHVHFEVYKNGRSVDPASYIQRTIR